MSEEMSAELRELLDREAIRDCLARYARGVDRLDRELLLSAYHEDAVDDHGKFLGSPAEFADWAFAMHSGFHVSHQHAILGSTFDIDGDTAHVETYFLFLAMNRSGRPWSLSSGRYIDRFERRDGRWAIAFRVCVRDWASTDTHAVEGDQSTLTATPGALPDHVRAFFRSAPAGARDRSDPSYTRPLNPSPQRTAQWRAQAEADR